MDNDDDFDITTTCAQCGSRNVETKFEHQQFPYGVGCKQVMLSAYVPMRYCQDCGFVYTDWQGEDARDAAVLRHISSKPTASKSIIPFNEQNDYHWDGESVWLVFEGCSINLRTRMIGESARDLIVETFRDGEEDNDPTDSVCVMLPGVEKE